MIKVDVVCEAEHLPRLKLLQTHMLSLNVELQIHEDMPEVCSDRLLIVPKKRNSKLAALEVPDNCERIALFLDEQTEPIEADMQVILHSWPARSSDRHVETLARHLHSSRQTLSDKDIRDSSAADQQTNSLHSKATLGTALKIKRAERRKNVITLTLLGVGVVALVSLLESEPQQLDEQTESETEQQTPVEQSDTAEPLSITAVEEEAALKTEEETAPGRFAGSSAPTPGSAQQQSPEIVIIDETGAQVSLGNAPRLCSRQDLKGGLTSEPCHLVLF